MDIAQIATSAIDVITPYLARGGEELAKGVGKQLWELIRKPFASEKGQDLVRQLEENPSDAKLQGKVEGKLEELLEEHPDIAARLHELLETMQAGAHARQNTMNVSGDNSIAMQDVSGNNITINRSGRR